MRCVRNEKLMSIKHTRHNPITFIKGRPICGATACKGNRLEFLRYVSESICIQMCNAEPQQSAWLIKLAPMVSAGKCCASNKAPLLQSRAAVRGNSRPAGRRISSCTSRGRLGGQSCQEKGLGCYFSLFQRPFAILALYKYLSRRNTHLLLTPFRSPYVLVYLGPNT